MIALLAGVAVAADLDTVLAERLAAGHEGTWRSPTRPERTALQEAVSVLVRGAPSCDAAAVAHAGRLLAPIGLGVEQVDTVWVVHETGERWGAGVYAVRCGPAEPLVLQAPHAWYDLGTGVLVRQLFVAGDARVAAWNTVHRYRATPDETPEDEVHPADVCHQPGSLFQAATLGAAGADPGLRFVQLHGFGGHEPTDLIVSTGAADRPPARVAGRLAALGRVGTYGRDAWTLGGTRNVQGRALGAERFLHVELDLELRQALRSDTAMRTALAAALEGPWE